MYIKCENLKIVRTLFLPNQSKGKQRLARTHTEIGRSRRKFSVKLKWQLFLVREKVTGLSCTNHKMPLNFPFSSQREAWHWLSTQMVQNFRSFQEKRGKEDTKWNGSSRWNVCYAGYLHISFDKQLQCVCAHCSALLPLRFVKLK